MLKVRLSSAAALAVAALLVCVGSAGAAPEGTFTEFPVPTAASELSSIAPGPDGNLWFTEFKGEKIGRITPSGAISEFPIPSPGPNRPEGIAPGPDGNVWFTERRSDAIGQITPSGTIVAFPVPTPESEPEDITTGPDGNLWFTEYKANKIGRITPSGAISEFPLPTPESGPWRIVAGPDGNLWFTEYKANQIGRITPSGAIAEFPVLTAKAGPLGIAAGPDGNVWFTEFTGDQIGRITPAGAITEFPVPTTRSFPGDIAPGPDGNLWFAERAGNKVGRITPAGAISEFPIPTSESAPSSLAPGPDGNLWFNESGAGANKIGRIGTGAPEALASATTMGGGGEAGTAQTCNAAWATWASLQPSASLFGFDGYRWLLDGTQVATGQSFTPTVADIGHQLACAVTVTYPLLDVSASSASAPFAVLAPPPPAIGALRQSASSWREGRALARISRRRGRSPSRSHSRRGPPVGTTFSFTLSEQAQVSFTFLVHLSGRRTGRVCVAPSRRNARRRPCERTLTAGTLSFSGHSATNKVAFLGRLANARKLPAGSYTLTILATNSAGGQSTPRSLHFTIVK